MTRRIKCTFCGKGRSQVTDMIAGPKVEKLAIYICNECVDASYNVIHGVDESADEGVGEILPNGAIYSPVEINSFLDKYVIGQEEAKRVISVAVYNHYMRVTDDEDDNVTLEKSNIMMFGPTGVGKTLLVKTIAEFFELPYVIADATTLTEAGYMGADVENLLHLLLQRADGDVELASKGIIFIDEIDKIAKKSNVSISGRDISGEGVQQALLKIIEGTEIRISSINDFSSSETIDTSNILFLVSGAFNGLEDMIKKKMNKSSIGINSSLSGDIADPDIIRKLMPEDLITYGLIPEFVGRFPIYAVLDPLTEEFLLRILTEPINNLVAQYTKMFMYENVELRLTTAYLKEVVATAISQKTGARGLRKVLETTMQPLQYDLPEQARAGIRSVVIDSNEKISLTKRRRRKVERK